MQGAEVCKHELIVYLRHRGVVFMEQVLVNFLFILFSTLNFPWNFSSISLRGSADGGVFELKMKILVRE